MSDRRRRVAFNTGWAEANEGGEFEENFVWVGDRVVSRVVDVFFNGADGQPSLSMTINSSDGVPRVTRLLIEQVEGGREVRSTDLQNVKVADWIEAVLPWFTHEAWKTDDGGVGIAYADVDPVERRNTIKKLREAKRADRRRIGPELLRRVADVYQANAQDRAPEAVQRAFDVKASTAFRYIERARKDTDPETGEKFLPPRGEN